jgi:hypothetical protein
MGTIVLTVYVAALFLFVSSQSITTGTGVLVFLVIAVITAAVLKGTAGLAQRDSPEFGY